MQKEGTMDKQYDIIIIDSGVDSKHPWLEAFTVEGITISMNNNDLIVTPGTTDFCGHGTAVYYLLQSHVPDARILNIGLSVPNSDDIMLRKILEYIYNNISCTVINLSCGITQCDDIAGFEHVCNKMCEKGIVIVAAYNNDGIMSYPACFENVIGVDLSTSLSCPDSFYFIESRIVNIRYAGYTCRVPWANERIVFQQGASFCAPKISGRVWKFLQKTHSNQNNLLYALDQLRNSADQCVVPQLTCSHEIPFTVKRAILYPFNKEIQVVASFEDILKWKIVGIFDTKYSRQIGRSTKEIAYSYSKKEHIISNVDNIDWNADFDTVIIGHTIKKELPQNSAITKALLMQAAEHGKNAFIFDEAYLSFQNEFLERGHAIFCPVINPSDIPSDRFGKQYCISKPVIGVFGTSSQQGKMTVQILLRRALKETGYCVGHFGTEPSSFLFDCDVTYAMGYFSSVHISRYDAICCINELMHKIELTNPDVIIVGSQSQSIALSPGNIGFYPMAQYELLLGSWPDIIILCINPDDEIKYIYDTISFLESSCQSKVVALILYPGIHTIQCGEIVGAPRLLSLDEQTMVLIKLRSEFHIPVLLLNGNVGAAIAEICVNALSE